LRVEVAAVDAWTALGAVPPEDAAALRAAVEQNPVDPAFLARMLEIENETRHDVVAFVRAAEERYGRPARWVHYGLTSTDVVDTALNLTLVQALDLILADVQALVSACEALAQRYRKLPCIGRTHGIHAEPMTFGLKFLNFRAAFQRDLERLRAAREAVGVVMLSGSVGTFAHSDPRLEDLAGRALGLTPDPVSNQTVARDRHAQLLSALAILGSNLERVALEIRHLSRSEVREAREGFSGAQAGSSSMPHKKNPIGSENIAGLARVLRANAQAGLEDIPLWHERDISHSSVERIVLPDSTTLASYATRRLTGLLENLVVDEARVRANLDSLGGLVYSQRALNALIDAGLSRAEAYALVQRHALAAWDDPQPGLKDRLAADPSNPLSAEQLDEAFNLAPYLAHVDEIYARTGL
ncbi:MAG TPA: adenylosuccinate lyase, partial [Deinococcales bacterium]|nr:adenylosuccinate lyase [Deinococcales bacterium]